MALFKEIKVVPDLDGLKEAKTWCGLISEFVGTFLWITVAMQIGGDWAWGIAYAVVSCTIPGSFNTLKVFTGVLNGSSDVLQLILSFVFHFLGAVVAQYLAAPLGLAADEGAASLEFTGAGGAFSAEFYQFWFGREFIGVFLFVLFSARCSNAHGLPPAFATIAMVSIGFWMGGGQKDFMFIPARCFSQWAAFASSSSWATLVCQLWATLLGNVVLEYVWVN